MTFLPHVGVHLQTPMNTHMHIHSQKLVCAHGHTYSHADTYSGLQAHV